jgi:hypothetical protein
MKEYGEVEVELSSLFTCALDRGQADPKERDSFILTEEETGWAPGVVLGLFRSPWFLVVGPALHQLRYLDCQ